jgi:hypothetical protein
MIVSGDAASRAQWPTAPKLCGYLGDRRAAADALAELDRVDLEHRPRRLEHRGRHRLARRELARRSRRAAVDVRHASAAADRAWQHRIGRPHRERHELASKTTAVRAHRSSKPARTSLASPRSDPALSASPTSSPPAVSKPGTPPTSNGGAPHSPATNTPNSASPPPARWASNASSHAKPCVPTANESESSR